MKSIILYKTRFGASSQYAKWLSNDLKIQLSKLDLFPVAKLKDLQRIILISGVYGGQIPAAKYLKTNWKLLKNKIVYLVVAGAAPQDNWWSKLSYWFALPKDIRENINYFKIRGIFENESKSIIKQKNLSNIIKQIRHEN